MVDSDTWGYDPQIRYMRGVFAAVEKAQREFLATAGISSMDERLRRFRETALKYFEHSWAYVMQRGLAGDESSAVAIYILCLARAMSARGINIPQGSLPADQKLIKLVEEALK